MTGAHRPRRGTAATILLLCFAGGSCYHELREAMRPVPLSDPISLAVDRFDELKLILPEHGTVCYLSDLDPKREPGNAGWYLAEYSLAPIVLKAGANCEIVIGNFANSAAAPAIIEQQGLRVLRQYDAGLMLLQRKQP